MLKLNNIFVVIDPTTEVQRGLIRAVDIAKITNARIHAYACTYSWMETDDPQALEQAERERLRLWLEKIVAPVKAEGIALTSQIDWDSDWRSALVLAAEKSNCDLIIKPTHRRSRSKQMFMTTSDRSLLYAAHCPVLLVSSTETNESTKILIAVDLHRQNKQYDSILDAVIKHGKAVAATIKDGELHVVNAYTSADEYVHTTDVAGRTGVDPACVHIVGGSPEEAISKVAQEINAGLVIIGTSTKGSLLQKVTGYMAESLPNRVSHDILVVKPSEVAQPAI